MIKLLGEYIIRKRYKDAGEAVTRQVYGTICSIIGIMLNVMLFTGKGIAGIISGSIAITADAVNNLSDAGSSFITLVGFRLGGRKPDSDHPFGHGRYEYISGFIVSMAILMMGVQLVKSSIKKIVKPELVEIESVALIILVVSVGVKFYMVCYNRHIGKKINSAAMMATAMDSLSDMVATSVVLLSMLVGKYTSLNIDGYAGLLVALFIMYAGITAARDTISPLLGKKPDPEFVEAIRDIVMSHDCIAGMHDVVVHDYGPGRVMISLHAEVPGDGDIFKMHDDIDHIERELTEKLGCSAVIHMDPIETDNEIVNQLREKVETHIRKVYSEATTHDFRMVVGPTHTNIIFDIVVPYSVKESDTQVRERVCRIINDIDSTYCGVITVDRLHVDLK